MFVLPFSAGKMQALRQDVPVYARVRLLQGGGGPQLLVVQAGLPLQGLLPEGAGGGRGVPARIQRQHHRTAVVVSERRTAILLLHPLQKKREKRKENLHPPSEEEREQRNLILGNFFAQKLLSK